MMFEPHFISIDTTKKAYDEDPFVLANQAKQVFYINDPTRDSGWKIIERSTHRHLWDLPDNEDVQDMFKHVGTSSDTSPFQASDCENFEFHVEDGEEEFVEIVDVDAFEDDLDDFIDYDTIPKEINEELLEDLEVTSIGEGSEGELNPKLCMLRRRKRVMASVDATGIDYMFLLFTKTSSNTEAEARPYINKKTSQILENQPDACITLIRDTYTKKFIGDSTISFATEAGIVMRSFCQMEFHTWEKVAKENKEEMINKLCEKSKLPQEDKVQMDYVDEQMRRQWKCTRNIFKDYWKKNGGMTDPQLARSKMKPDCRSEEDWGYLCDYWESDKAKETILQLKEEEYAKLVSAGTSITQEMEYGIEKKSH
ncbi:unnamed protein product [Lactuca saligna]|uniref:DUF4216 domain-containing protein n=1 Tax=Lactuca saligna TaxID=75948 RepID=A0AA36EFU0_LACSI|nr:unnamed protein product [Lactuca saligna]